MANLVNQAALRGSADGKDAVTMKDFDWARDKIIMGDYYIYSVHKHTLKIFTISIKLKINF